MDSKVEYWFGIADYDFETAKVMLRGERYLYVGFMCHQTIEKALKAIIARDCADEDIPPKIHHLLKLAERSGLLAVMSVEQVAFIKRLNQLNIEARYSEYKEAVVAGLNTEICLELLAGTEDLLCWIKQRL